MWFLLTWGSQNHQPVLWKPNVVLLNTISAKVFVGFFLYFLYEKRPQSVCTQGHVNPWLCPSNLSCCPCVSAPFPAWGNTYFMLRHMLEVFLPGFDFGCLVLWGLVKRLLELDWKDAHNSLEEPREGLYFISCFIPVKLYIGAEKCLFPIVLYHQYVSVHCCCASKTLPDASGLVCWWVTLVNCQGIRLPGLSREGVLWFLNFYLWVLVPSSLKPNMSNQSISWVACLVLGLV